MSSRRTQLETAENGSSGSGWARIEKEGRLGRRGLRQERGGKGRGWMDGRMDGKERMGSFAILSSLVAGIDRRIKPRQTYFPFCLLAAYTVFCDEDFGPGPSSFQMDVLHHEFSESMFCWYITSPFRGGEMGNRVSSTDVLKPLKPCVLALDRINDSQRHVGLFKGNPFRLKFKILDINSLTRDWPLQQFYLLVGLFGNFVFFFFFRETPCEYSNSKKFDLVAIISLESLRFVG